MKLKDCKVKAKELGINDEFVRGYGRLTATATWLKALEEKEKQQKDFEQVTKSANNFNPFIEKIKALNTKKEIEEATEEYVSFLRKQLPNDVSFEPRVSNLITEIKRNFPNYPDKLSSEYIGKKGNRVINFCAVTVAYKVRNQLLSSTTEAITEAITEPTTEPTTEAITEAITEAPKKAEAPKPVVKLDFKKIVKVAEQNLTSNDWAVLGGAVAFLTGRRPSEIFCLSQFEVISENQMTITDIAKKRGDERTKFQFPVLGNADDILEAIEKIRRLKPMPDVLETYLKDGLSKARTVLNSNYSGGKYGYCKIFQDNFGHLLNDVDDGSFKTSRHFYASANCWIYKSQSVSNGETSLSDAINFAKKCVAHESGDTTLKYTDLEFENLPTVDRNYFENIGQKTMTDGTFTANLDNAMSHLSLQQQIEAKKLLQFSENYDKLFADLLINKLEKQTPSQPRIIREKITASDKILWIIQAMINHNKNLLDDKETSEDTKLYITITKASIDNMCKHILGSNQAPKTLTECYERCLNSITDSNEKWNKSRDSKIVEQKRNNLHIRPTRNDRSKMDIVVSSISNAYNALQM